MNNKGVIIVKSLFVSLILSFNTANAKSKVLVEKTTTTSKNHTENLNKTQLKNNEKTTEDIANFKEKNSIIIEYKEVGNTNNIFKKLAKQEERFTNNGKTTKFSNSLYQVIINEIDRGTYTEVNGEVEYLAKEANCVTLRVVFPLSGDKWQWHHGIGKSTKMVKGSLYADTKKVETVLPPDGAFNTNKISNGGYGDAIGQGNMSFYPLCAVNVDGKGENLGVDMSLPIVYRLSAMVETGLMAEFDIATSPATAKFPNRAFFKLSRFTSNGEWGMRAALKKYYGIYKESFKKRVVNEGVWLPFTPLRSIKNWEDFGFVYHELSWNSFDKKEGESIPTIASDKGTDVLSFQYTEPWDVQLPILTKEIAYDTLVSNKMVPLAHQEYLKNSATEDKNGLWHTRRLKTPWFNSGWAVSITTNSDPDIEGANRYQYVKKTEITPAIKMNVDGIYFDSMEWNWHHDLNYRKDHFKYTDYPLSFSKDVNRPAIWHFTSEFEMMKKIANQMHAQGKLVMGNGHVWNPFAAANLDLFGAELSWYSTGEHGAESLDFKRIISFQKPIVFLLNEGLNDKAFTDFPYKGYEIYFEKLLAYGFFPSFFSTDASSDPYWMDAEKIENGRPFFKKYIPIVKQISGAGWEPITYATCNLKQIRIERFGETENLFFTVRNNGTKDIECEVALNLKELKISKKFTAMELIYKKEVKVKRNKLQITVPANSTRVFKVKTDS